jgi:membrane-bound serine protease (ClpP class)
MIALSFSQNAPAAAEQFSGGVFWIPIDDGPDNMRGMIDGWLSHRVRGHIAEAKAQGATKIIFAIRTYGGQVDAAVEIVNSIQSAAPIETIAYVNDRAISAGALIALSCDRIYMKNNSMMGDAMAITVDPEGNAKAVGEKITSFMRAVFRSVAQKRSSRGARGFEETFIALAESMTDPDVVVLHVEVDGESAFVRQTQLNAFLREMDKEGRTVEVFDPVVHEGKLLTVTTKEAVEQYQFIDGAVEGREELLKVLGVDATPMTAPEVSWPEELARFIGGPAVSGLLISIAMFGLMMEMFAPGKGVGAMVFLFGIGAFFWSHMLAGQAGPFEVVFFLIGVALLAVEAFVIPGFGVAGISGIILVAVSLVLSFLPSAELSAPGLPDVPFPYERLHLAIFTVVLAGLAATVAIVVAARFIPHIPLFKHLVLEAPGAGALSGALAPVAADALSEYVGKRGVAHTDLRPAGKIEVDEELLDAVTEAEFLGKGTVVLIVETGGNRLVVKQADEEERA